MTSPAEVQNANAAGAGTSPIAVSFASNVTIGNSIVVWIGDYDTSGSVISSVAPTYNGGSVTGATKLLEVQNAGSNVMYFAVWLLPNVQSSAKSVSITAPTNGRHDSSAHYFIAEFSGLGTSPTLDSAGTNPKTASSNAGGTLTSGATGNAVGTSGIVLGGMMEDGSTGWTGPAGWTQLTGSTSTLIGASYQIFTSSGSAYTWSSTGSSAGQWAAGAVILDASAGGGGSPAPSLLLASFP